MDMKWHRRRDLEGGKELGVWLCRDDTGAVTEENSMLNHTNIVVMTLIHTQRHLLVNGRILVHSRHGKKRLLLLVSILIQLPVLLCQNNTLITTPSTGAGCCLGVMYSEH